MPAQLNSAEIKAQLADVDRMWRAAMDPRVSSRDLENLAHWVMSNVDRGAVSPTGLADKEEFFAKAAVQLQAMIREKPQLRRNAEEIFRGLSKLFFERQKAEQIRDDLAYGPSSATSEKAIFDAKQNVAAVQEQIENFIFRESTTLKTVLGPQEARSFVGKIIRLSIDIHGHVMPDVDLAVNNLAFDRAASTTLRVVTESAETLGRTSRLARTLSVLEAIGGPLMKVLRWAEPLVILDMINTMATDDGPFPNGIDTGLLKDLHDPSLNPLIQKLDAYMDLGPPLFESAQAQAARARLKADIQQTAREWLKRHPGAEQRIEVPDSDNPVLRLQDFIKAEYRRGELDRLTPDQFATRFAAYLQEDRALHGEPISGISVREEMDMVADKLRTAHDLWPAFAPGVNSSQRIAALAPTTTAPGIAYTGNHSSVSLPPGYTPPGTNQRSV